MIFLWPTYCSYISLGSDVSNLISGLFCSTISPVGPLSHRTWGLWCPFSWISSHFASLWCQLLVLRYIYYPSSEISRVLCKMRKSEKPKRCASSSTLISATLKFGSERLRHLQLKNCNKSSHIKISNASDIFPFLTSDILPISTSDILHISISWQLGYQIEILTVKAV